MNKKFLSAILFGALMVTSTGTFVSCKDYDDDIDSLQGQVDTNVSAIDALKTQLSSLQTAGSAAQATADAAKAAADAAKKAGDEALAAAKDAEAAVAQAKADAIAEATKQVEALKVIVEANKLSQDQLQTLIATVSGKVEAIDADINELKGLVTTKDGKTLADIAAVVADLEEQIAALQAGGVASEEITGLIESLQGQLNTVTGNVWTLIEDVDAIMTAIAGNQENVDAAIADLNQRLANSYGELDELWAEINGEGANSIRTQMGQLANLINELQTQYNTLSVLVAPRLASLTFIPKSFVGGVEAILFGSYEYNALTLEKVDSKDEAYTEAEELSYANPAVYAQYHVSPTNASIDEVKDQLSFDIIKNADYIHSRSDEASEDFDVKAEFVSLEEGILTVKVNITGTPAEGKKISVVALQVKDENGTVVTSDYATIYKQELDELAIADKKKFAGTPKVDYHFRRYINTVDEEASNDQVVWEHYTDESIDLIFDYKESLNLNEYVGVHVLGKTHSAANLEELGMNLEYDIVKNYIIGENETDQKDFVELNDGVLTAKVFNETGAAAIGRTPIVRVRLMNGEEIVKIAYIKVLISKNVPENKAYTLVVDDFEFDCDVNGVVTTKVEQINTQLYNVLDLSKAEFHAMYQKFDDVTVEGDLGTVEELTEQVEGETTHLLKWTITNEKMWENAGKTVSNTIYYRVSEGSNVFVAVKLTSKLEDLPKEYDITKADFINEYWNAEKTYTKFNVAVPSTTTDENPDNCTFINNLNAPFTTWAKGTANEGLLKLNENVTDIEFFFCEEVKNIKKIGDIDVIIYTDNDGLTLFAKKKAADAPQTIATIDNEDEALGNVVKYNKESDLAKELLNTKKMYTYIGAKGYVCGTKEVSITFDGKDHFQAEFIRPVNITETAGDFFIDGVDFGEDGSFIRLEDLIAPCDWRGRDFADYDNYWHYYGPFEITVETESAECDLNGVRQAVPKTVELEQKSKDEQMGTESSDYGFLTYKNNGNNVSAFNIYVKVDVKYGWGVIKTGFIKVPVASTIAAE